MSSTESNYERLLGMISSNIKFKRKERGLTQNDMVDYGFELRNYQRIESGSHSPSLFTLHRLAQIFNCAIDELVKYVER